MHAIFHPPTPPKNTQTPCSSQRLTWWRTAQESGCLNEFFTHPLGVSRVSIPVPLAARWEGPIGVGVVTLFDSSCEDALQDDMGDTGMPLHADQGGLPSNNTAGLTGHQLPELRRVQPILLRRNNIMSYAQTCPERF
jgi:hypothetical protein